MNLGKLILIECHSCFIISHNLHFGFNKVNIILIFLLLDLVIYAEQSNSINNPICDCACLFICYIYTFYKFFIYLCSYSNVAKLSSVNIIIPTTMSSDIYLLVPLEVHPHIIAPTGWNIFSSPCGGL